MQANSLPAELQRKPKNTGMGSLSLLQQIFLIQESNCGLLHCRRNLFQLSYQGSPRNSQFTGVGSLSLLEGIFPTQGIKPRSPALQVDSLPAEPQEKPKNTGMGSLSLLQGIFLIQDSSLRLLHCRQILYQLSYEGSPKTYIFRTMWYHIRV